MRGRRLRVLAIGLAFAPPAVYAQAEIRPAREFTSLRGTWTLDESAGRGHIAGVAVARTLVVATTAMELSIASDGHDADVFRLDGTETSFYDTHRIVTLVADMLAATTRRTRRTDRGYAVTTVVTDAYAVNGDVLTVERQMSVVVAPLTLRDGRATDVAGPGHLAELENPNNYRQTLIYRRGR
jgi:hypothetical protein